MSLPPFDPRNPGTVVSVLSKHAAERPDKLAISIGEHAWTFAELDARTDEVAAGFAAQGLGYRDRVAVLTSNRGEVLECTFGLAKLGVIQVPLNAFLKGEFLRHQLSHSRATVLVADEAGCRAVEPLRAELPDLERVVALDPGTADLDYAEVTAPAGSFEAPDLAAADTMAIFYTSGTTGLPKGCVVSHGYYLRSGQVNGDAMELSDDDVVYTGLPLFHSGGQLLVLMTAFVRGLTIGFELEFSAGKHIENAAAFGATMISGVGPMAMAILASPEKETDRDHTIHTMMTAPLSEPDQARMKERFGIDAWTEVFGQTECVPVSASSRLGERDRGGIGHPCADMEVAMLDDDNLPVPDGEIGEIGIRPAHRFAMFDGYWEMPEETLQAFRGLWYHTGDYGLIRPSGELQFKDRKKDSLRRRGENVSSLELEAAICAHPAIVEAAALAVPSELGEDDIKVCVVFAEGQASAPEETFAHFKDNLPYFAIPRYVERVDSLPRNAVGRIMKHLLRDRPLSDQVWDFDALGLTVGRDERR